MLAACIHCATSAHAHEAAQTCLEPAWGSSCNGLHCFMFVHVWAFRCGAFVPGRLQEKGVGADQEWQSILRRPLFAGAEQSASASLVHLIDIFVERQHLLWKVCLPPCLTSTPFSSRSPNHADRMANGMHAWQPERDVCIA